MARIGDTCVSIGNADWYIGDAESYDPTANIDRDFVRSLVGGSVTLSGLSSYTDDPDGDVLYYIWQITFPERVTAPAPTYGIDDRDIQIDTDALGLYQVSLQVIGANGGCGTTDSALVLSVGTAGPQYEGTSLDTSWLWQLLPSAWSKADQENRLKIELFWRGLLQTIGSDLTRLYAFDRNKAVMHASELRPARWVPISLDLSLEDVTLIASPVEQVAVNASGLSLPIQAQTARIKGTVLSPRELLPDASSVFTPSMSDRGRVITLDLPDGTSLTTRIANVRLRSDFRMTYVLAEPGLEQFIRNGVTFRLPPSPRTSPRGVVHGGLGAVYTGATRIAGVAPPDGEHISKPMLRLQDAQVNGVRAGDLVTTRITNQVSNTSVDVDVQVDAVVTDPTGHDYVIFSPIEQTFSALLSDLCDVLFPEYPRSFTELSVALGPDYWTRSEGVYYKSQFTVTHTTAEYTFDVAVELRHIRRRSVCRVDPKIYRLTALREQIEVHQTDESGTVLLPESGRLRYLGRAPVTLLENTHFEVYPDGITVEGLSYTTPNAYVTHPTRTFDVDVGPGDTLVILEGFGRGRYQVKRVEGARVYLQTPPRFSFSGAQATFYARLRGSYVVFAEDALPSLNSVGALWAESATIRDVEELESTFGKLAQLPFATWRELGSQVTYADTLRAVHYARMRGSTIDSLLTLVSATLGLPYTPSREVVVRHDRGYRTDESGTYDKVFTELISARGDRLGEYRVYFVKSAASSALPEMLGVTDPVIEGAALEPGTLLGRGVEIIDANDAGLTRPQDRHTFDVRISAGAAPLTLAGIRYTASEIDRCKPSYTDFTLTPILSVGDDINIESDVFFRMLRVFKDTPYGLHGPAEVLDDFIPGIGYTDDAPFTVLSTWFPHDAEVRYEDGVTILTSATGGFAVAPQAASFSVRGFDDLGLPITLTYSRPTRYDQGAWITPGDIVIFLGTSGHRPAVIEEVVNDNELRLAYTGEEVTEGDNLRFVVVRQVRDVLLDTALVSFTAENGVEVVELGARASNVGRGDVVSFKNTNDPARPIVALRDTTAYLQTSGYPPLSADAREAGRDIRIRRPHLEPHTKGEFVFTESPDEGLLVYKLEGSADYLGLRVGDEVEGRVITSILPLRGYVTLSRPLPTGSYTVTQPAGVRGEDALDLASGGVRSAVSLRLTYRNIAVSRSQGLLELDHAGLIETAQAGDLLTIVPVIGGAPTICRVTGVEDTGLYTNLAEDVNLPVRAGVTLERQAPLRPVDWR